MSAALTAVLSAVLAAGAPAGERVALAGAGAPQSVHEAATTGLPESVRDVATTGLPPPPETVVRQTRTFGTITIDHRKHLSLRANCVRCHGPGPVSKLEFTPRIAHERCVGCHKEREAGPTECRGCHQTNDAPGGRASPPALAEGAEGGGQQSAQTQPPGAAASDAASTARQADRTPPPRVTLAPARPRAAAASPSGGGPEVEPPTAAGSASPAAATAPVETAEASAVVEHRFEQRLELGFAAAPGIGAAMRVSQQDDRFYRAYGVERFASGGSARILTLLDFGMGRPFRQSWEVVGSGVVGVDAQERPAIGLAGVLGARIRLEWTPPFRSPVRLMYISLTGVRDLPVTVGSPRADTRLFATVGTAVTLRRR